jgi:hypothetical protein
MDATQVRALAKPVPKAEKAKRVMKMILLDDYPK